MEDIFHEKQEGSLCAQHCLNVLLQGEYFTAVDLATIGHQIDAEEQARMAEGGVNSEDYRKFIEQPSPNFDDSGYFSVQVIASALKVWNLELIPFKSKDPVAQSALKDPTKNKAYICNYRDHWLTIRKIGYQWFNLNSLLTGPELLSDTYLSLFLAQLQQEGYSIFIVLGVLPECTSDKTLRLCPAVQIEKPRLLSEVKSRETLDPAQQKLTMQDEDDPTLRQTLKLSLQKAEEQQMQTALSLSLTEFQKSSKKECASTSSSTEVECTSIAFAGTSKSTESSASTETAAKSETIDIHSTDEMSEQEMLDIALKMSMEGS